MLLKGDIYMVVGTLQDWPATQDAHIHSHECSKVDFGTEGNSYG